MYSIVCVVYACMYVPKYIAMNVQCVCHVCVKTKRKARAVKAKSNNDSRIVVGIIHLQMNSKDLIPKIKNHQKIYDLSLFCLEGST